MCIESYRSYLYVYKVARWIRFDSSEHVVVEIGPLVLIRRVVGAIVVGIDVVVEMLLLMMIEMMRLLEFTRIDDMRIGEMRRRSRSTENVDAVELLRDAKHAALFHVEQEPYGVAERLPVARVRSVLALIDAALAGRAQTRRDVRRLVRLQLWQLDLDWVRVHRR